MNQDIRSASESVDAAAQSQGEATAPGATYDCQQTGEPKRDRRKFVRGPADERVEGLFNGFENMINNAEPYNAGYLRAMRKEFAEIMRSASLPAARPQTGASVAPDTEMP